MDVAQAALAVFMFAENGNFKGEEVEGIDPEKFVNWMVIFAGFFSGQSNIDAG